MGITPNSLTEFLYKKLPHIYQEEDTKLKQPFKRYLESLVDGGYAESLKDIEGNLLLTDPSLIPEEFFPYLCESFGLEYFPDIDIKYQRRFLLNIGELNKRRGTFSSVHFLIRALTGLESDLSVNGNTLKIVLLAKTMEQIDNIEPSRIVIGNYISTQIPYYITPEILSRVAVQPLYANFYVGSAMRSSKKYTLTATRR